MLFNSFEFCLFLPVAFAFYWLLRCRWHWQNAFLLAASYVFYAMWDVRFLWLIAGVSLTAWLSGMGIARFGRGSRRAKGIVAAQAAVSLGFLFVFKYFNFFVDAFISLSEWLGFSACRPLWQVALPVGISFYTFQALAYVIDVYRGETKACRSALTFFTFIAFFPQLVAGPIERAARLLPYFDRPRSLDYASAVDGLRLLLWGMVKKTVIADNCATIVNAIYANPNADGTDLWVATFFFAIQIYGDFSGYSDIAVGCGRLFGIPLMQNFRLPYFSRSVAEFWRRWHISLMSWFRDYIYIPLGGSRGGRLRTAGNTFIVFLLSGLWHGANFTFVLWGAYHACLFLPGILLRKQRRRNDDMAAGGSLPSFHVAWQMGRTFLLVCLGWVLFRSEDVSAAGLRLQRMFTDLHWHVPFCGRLPLLLHVVLLLVEWFTRHREHPLDLPARGLWRSRAVRYAVYYALILSVLQWGGTPVEFIYFQF